jgi:hypothetical protein
MSLVSQRLGSKYAHIFKFDYPPDQRAHLTASGRRTRGQRKYICLHCSPDKWTSLYTNNSKNHALSHHPELLTESPETDTPSSSIGHPRLKTQSSMDSFITSTPSTGSYRMIFNHQRYNDALVSLLTRRRVAFSAVEWDEMKELVLAGNPHIEDCLITTRYRMLKIIDSNYDLYTSQLKDLLQESQSMIHISTDLWTSPNRHGMLAVCAQWVDKQYNLRKALLGMPECQFNHSGESQAGLIMDILYKFAISRIGYHIGDNATSNDTCLAALSERLKAELDVS